MPADIFPNQADRSDGGTKGGCVDGSGSQVHRLIVAQLIKRNEYRALINAFRIRQAWQGPHRLFKILQTA
jgi:hypothetical protein